MPTPETSPNLIDRIPQPIDGCFIDFEGRKGKMPVMLGILTVDGGVHSFEQLIINPDFQFLEPAKTKSSKYPRFKDLDAVTEHLPESLPVFSWSTHEQRVLTTFAQAGLSRRVTPLTIINAIPKVRSWRSRFHSNWVPAHGWNGSVSHTQSAYARKVGFRVPEKYGSQVTGSNLELLEGAQLAGRTLRTMTTRQRSAWRTVLLHNRYDCFGLLAIMSRVMSDIAR